MYLYISLINIYKRWNNKNSSQKVYIHTESLPKYTSKKNNSESLLGPSMIFHKLMESDHENSSLNDEQSQINEKSLSNKELSKSNIMNRVQNR